MIPNLHRTRTFPSSMTLEDSDRTLIVETLEGWWTTRRRRETRTEANTLLAKMRRLGISRPIHQEETVTDPWLA
jgi:hypothetical protein